MFQPTTECVDSLTIDDVTGQAVPESGTGRTECCLSVCLSVSLSLSLSLSLSVCLCLSNAAYRNPQVIYM